MQENNPGFDFVTPAGRQGWEAVHDLAPLSGSAEGIIFRATGDDPYAVSPSVAVSPGKPYWLKMRIKASQNGIAQFFYFPEGEGASERNSIRFPVSAGEWREIFLPLPAFTQSRYRFRLDPPGNVGAATILSSLRLLPRIETPEPEWTRPGIPQIPANAPTISSGAVTLKHGSGLGAFAVLIGGERFAIGNNHPLLGYQVSVDQPARWLSLAGAVPAVFLRNGAIVVTATITDPEGADWTITQKFLPGKQANSVSVESSLVVTAARRILHYPFLTLLPGVGTFGEKKNQAILAGVEYLDRDEPSSSEADIKGPEAQRQVPDRSTLTLPLMAIVAGGKWISLVWEPSADVAACFDSPDRRFKSGGHLLSLLYPGAEGMSRRAPGSLLPLASASLPPKQTVSARATIYGGSGGDITLAVRAYIAGRGLPVLTAKEELLAVEPQFAAGWLDSGIKAGNRYRHAYPGDFGPQPAADAAVCQDWLANPGGQRPSATVSSALIAASRAARAGIAPPELRVSGVGHIRTPAALLAYSSPADIQKSLQQAVTEARELLQRLDADNGRIKYRPSPGRPDYGKTHFADHANGMTAEIVARALDLARLTGDQRIIRDATLRLQDLDNLYRGTVPRGAQTWEVPLHTPDILASAHLVRAFVRGYELTDESRYLESARYWAWTGIPFVYLVPPTAHPIGLYGTTPVLGATNWEAPNWIGLPVQWCGLVYADALYDLAYWDKGGIWERIANGIVLSGIQQTWPRYNGKEGSDKARQGLLPDSFNLTGQIRNDVAINPATLQTPFAQMTGKPIYTAWRFGLNGQFVHAPGAISAVPGLGSGLRFAVDSRLTEPYQILLTGVFEANIREVRVNGRPTPYLYDFREGRLLIPTRGKCTIEILY